MQNYFHWNCIENFLRIFDIKILENLKLFKNAEIKKSGF